MSVSKKIKHLIIVLTILFSSSLAFTFTANAEEFKGYVHNPEINCSVTKSVKKDPNAVYGYSPRADQGTLKQFADLDWSDPEIVGEAKANREAYFLQYRTMYDKLVEMYNEGKTAKEIAEVVCPMRNQIRLDSYKDDKEGLARVKQRNLEQWGREEGPTVDQLYAKYGSWEKVVVKAFSENAAMDACLGLYDDRIEYYILLENYELHDPVIDKGKEATESTTGLTDGAHCSKCGLVLVEQEVIPRKIPQTGNEDYIIWIILGVVSIGAIGYYVNGAYAREKK